MNKNKGNDVFAPALHRVTGYANSNGNKNDAFSEVSGQCLSNQIAPSDNSMAFPPDLCHGTTCGAFGKSPTWGVEAYVAKNYGTDEDPVSFADLKGKGYFKTVPDIDPTRFDVYKAEHEAAKAAFLDDDTDQVSLRPNVDLSGDICADTTRSLNPNRRVFIAAGIDCAANAINGAKKGVPVKEYYEVFLMGPVGMENGGSSNFDLHVEMIGPAGGDGSGDEDDGGIFRVVVELLR